MITFMGRRWTRSAFALGVVAFASAAVAGDVDLEFRVPVHTVRAGGSVEVGLYAVSGDGAEQAIGGIDAILSWDPDVLELAGKTDDGPYNWLTSRFPVDSGIEGLNADCGADVFCDPYSGLPFNDGDALYQAVMRFPPSPPAYATSAGLLVTTIRFTALTALSATEIGLLGNVSGQWTTVADARAVDITGELTPVTLLVAPCGEWGDFDGDCAVNLAEYGSFESCLTGPGGGPVSVGCHAADTDGDGDVDLWDYRGFQSVYGSE